MTELTDDAGFRHAQRLAYTCVEAVAAGLAPGDTEREACARMRAWLAAHGAREYLHAPFAWFGDRTAFTGFRTPLAFFPTRRRLEAGMPYILDCAPIVDGYTADVGYTGWVGHSPIAARLLDDLVHHRALVLEQVAAGAPVGAIYDAVTALAARQGHTTAHRAYPFGVLGHRVERLEAGRSRLSVAGFGLRSLVAFAKIVRGGSSPLWNGTIAADRPLPHGRWAVEPHLAFRGIGAKFEEILVVDAAGVRWLDDDLPHVRHWRRLGSAQAVVA